MVLTRELSLTNLVVPPTSPGNTSRQMEDLENLTVDTERRRIISFTIGPANPTRDEYRIDTHAVIRDGPRRLLPVRSCELNTGRTEEAVSVPSVVTYADGRDFVKGRTVGADCDDPYEYGCLARYAGKPGGR